MSVLQNITVPLLAVNDSFLTVIEIKYTSGAAVKKDDIVMVLETSKTTYDVVAETDGFIKYLCEADKDYDVNELVAVIYSSDDEAITMSDPVSVLKTTASGLKPTRVAGGTLYKGTTLFSNPAMVLIGEKNIDAIVFSGYDMVTLKDVEAYLHNGMENGNGHNENRNSEKLSSKKQNSVLPEGTTSVQISKNKKREIEYLTAVQHTGLVSTVSTNISTIGLFGRINQHLKYFKNNLLPLLLYETSRLLVKYPLLNAFYHKDSIYTYDEINPGFAIDIDNGLKVLKIPKANELTMDETEAYILELSGKYVDNKIAVDSLTGISFTITDLSGEGVAYFKPLVNIYNSGIMAVSAIDDGLQRFDVSVSFDHRVMEGKYVAQFLAELKVRIESYALADNEAYSHIHCYKCFKTLKEDLADVGLLPVLTTEGKHAHICQTCWNGL